MTSKEALKEIDNIFKNKPRTIYLSIENNPKLITNEYAIELDSVIGTFNSKGGKCHRIKLKETDYILVWEMGVSDRVVKDGKCYLATEGERVMTSKEAFCSNFMPSITIREKELWDKIKSDLELLAIYERVIEIRDYNGIKVVSGVVSNEDYEKIKELRKV